MINSQGARDNRESGGDKGEESHFDSSIDDQVDDGNLLTVDTVVAAIKVQSMLNVLDDAQMFVASMQRVTGDGLRLYMAWASWDG